MYNFCVVRAAHWSLLEPSSLPSAHSCTYGEVPPWLKNQYTPQKWRWNFQSLFDGTLPKTKIELQEVRCLLPAKVTVDFSKLEKEIAILSYQHTITIRQEEFNERRSVKGFVASLCPKHFVLQRPTIVFIDNQLLFSTCYTHLRYSTFTIRLRYSCASYKWLEYKVSQAEYIKAGVSPRPPREASRWSRSLLTSNTV